MIDILMIFFLFSLKIELSISSFVLQENTDEDGAPLVKCLSRVVSFFTQTVIGAILEGNPSEETISTLIPSISAGLKSTDFPDYIMSSYLILSHLLVSCNLSQSLLESLLSVICKVSSIWCWELMMYILFSWLLYVLGFEELTVADLCFIFLFFFHWARKFTHNNIAYSSSISGIVSLVFINLGQKQQSNF